MTTFSAIFIAIGILAGGVAMVVWAACATNKIKGDEFKDKNNK